MILFTSDLLFGSKILGAAKHAGLRGQGVRNRASLVQHAPNATHFFLDLETDLAEGESAEALLDAALGHPNLCVYVFAGHLQTEKLRAAQTKLAEATRARAAASRAANDDVGAHGSPTELRHEVHSRGSLSSRLHVILPPRPVGGS